MLFKCDSPMQVEIDLSSLTEWEISQTCFDEISQNFCDVFYNDCYKPIRGCVMYTFIIFEVTHACMSQVRVICDLESKAKVTVQ